jgi:hypothetical protein
MSDSNYSDAYPLDVNASGKRFEGKFRFKLELSVADRLRIGRLRRQYLGADNVTTGLDVDLYDLTLATALSEVLVRVKQDEETPEWWAKRSAQGDLPEPVVLKLWEESRAIDQKIETRRKEAEDAARNKLRDDRDRQLKESESR